MFFHLADKLYVVNEESAVPSIPDIKQVHLPDILNELNLFPSFSHFVKSLVDSIVEDRCITLIILPIVTFEDLLNIYCGRLSLGEEAFNIIQSYSSFCENYLEDFAKTISQPYHYNLSYRKDISEKLYFRELWPAELCINQLNEMWANDKYEYFRMYDFYLKIKEYQLAKIQSDTMFCKEITCDDQSIKDYYRDERFIEKVAQEIDTSFLKISIQEYVDSKPMFGYNRFNAWKYNWPLANYIRRIGYRL